MTELDFLRVEKRMDSLQLLNSRKQCCPQAQKLKRQPLMILDPPHSWWICLPWPMKRNIRGYSAHETNYRFKPRNSSFARRDWWTGWLRQNRAHRKALQATP